MNENNSNSNGRWEFDRDGNVHYVPPSGNSSPTPPRPSQKTTQRPVSSGKKSSNDWHWIVIVLAFIFFWPVGLILLFLELSGKWPANQKVEQEVNRAAKAVKNTVKQAQPQHASAQSKKTAAPPEKKLSRRARKKQQYAEARSYGLGGVSLFHTLGWLLTVVFGVAFIAALPDAFSHFTSLGYLLQTLIPLVCLIVLGIVFLCVAASRGRKLKKFRKYKKLIGSREEISLAALSRAMGTDRKKVLRDVEEMLERDVFPVGYIDAFKDALILRDGLDDTPQEAPAQNPGQAASTLARIRQLNDAIAHPEISRQIAHIEMLTAKIFRLLDEQPEKAGELRSFMNYYLPQTLKILENYAKLEAQGIDSGNIAEAKQKIESMMGKLVEGYETQLDKLFANDVLDISADLKVMESMLAKDGLTVQDELHL